MQILNDLKIKIEIIILKRKSVFNICLLTNYGKKIIFAKIGKFTPIQEQGPPLNVLNDWTNSLENKLTTDWIYLDYQKAFDSVPHKRLISKLPSYRFNPVIISWVENYLRDRSQYVEINGEQSQWQPVTSGIPQGSVLGPLLFLIYINDLPKHVNSTIYMYADDTKIYRKIRDKHDQEILQKDLDSLKAWSDLDGRKVGHFLITIQKSFKLIIN